MEKNLINRLLFLIPLVLVLIGLTGYLVYSNMRHDQQVKQALAVPTEAAGYIQTGEFEKALALYNQQIQSGVNPAEAYALRGDYYIITRHFDEALKDYSTSLGHKPSAAVLTSRCNAYRLLAKYKLAEKDCQDAIKLDPQIADTYTVLAGLYLDQSQTGKARETYEQAAKIDPNSAKAHYILAQIEIKAGNLDAAVEALSKCIEEDASNPQFYWERGFISIAMGKVDAAKADMRAILKYGNPATDGDLLQKAGSTLASLGENP